MKKSDYRSIMRYKRKQLDKAKITEKSKAIIQRFTDSEYYNGAKLIMTYISIGGEVVTKRLIEQILRDNKCVAVPFCIKETKKMVACQINSLNELVPGTLGILEPLECDRNEIDIHDIDIIIVPALSFDRRLNRLGHGAGYYDRFLSQLGKRTLKVGLSYDFQLIDKLPKDEHDIPMDIIITESELITANKKGKA